MLDNLYDLLNVSELPQPPNVNEDEKISNTGIVSDEECCICFCLQLDDGEIPSEICNNEKCHRIFHTLCLYQVNLIISCQYIDKKVESKYHNKIFIIIIMK